MFYVYVLRCVDGTLYVGYTKDLASREWTHNEGKGAKYTAARRPVCMVYAEEHSSFASAMARERQLKRWSHKKKEALIGGDRASLRTLGRRPGKQVAEFTWRDLLKARSE
jgi:predicted GIY-YIG superfamily endonuclease